MFLGSEKAGFYLKAKDPPLLRKDGAPGNGESGSKKTINEGDPHQMFPFWTGTHKKCPWWIFDEQSPVLYLARIRVAAVGAAT